MAEHCAEHSGNVAKITSLEKRVSKIEEKTEDIPTMKVLLEQVIKSNDNQTTAIESIKEVVNSTNITMAKIGEGMDSLKNSQEKMFIELDEVKRQVVCEANKNMIDTRDIWKTIFSNTLVKIVGGLIVGVGGTVGVAKLIEYLVK